jgi:hypothetical protein
MRFEIGDTVRVKNTGEEGKVIAYLEKNLLQINIDNVEFPIFENEVEHPYLNWFLNKKVAQNKPSTNNDLKLLQKNTEAKVASGLKLIFVPSYKPLAHDEAIEKVKVYLSNKMYQGFAFNYFFESKTHEKFELDSEANSFQDFYLHDISYENLATNPYFEITCAEIIQDSKNEIKNYSDSFTIKPKKLFVLINEMLLKNEGFFSITLIENNDYQFQQEFSIEKPKQIEVVKNEPEFIFEEKKHKTDIKKIEIPKPEKIIPIISEEEKIEFKSINVRKLFINETTIDLHIEKLTPHHEKLSNSEKLIFQLDIFQKALEIAHFEKKNTLIVIHGYGKGVLKDKIHGILNQTIFVVSYVYQSDKRFGEGATEIFFGY